MKSKANSIANKEFASSNRLAKNTIINLIGMLLPLVVGLIAIPFAIKGLGDELFGALTIAWTIIASLTLLDFGIGRAATKYASESVRNGKVYQVNDIFWSAIGINTLLGLVGGLTFYIFLPYIISNYLNITQANLQETRNAFIVIAFLIPFLLITNSLKGILGAAQRFDLINFITIPVNALSFIFPIFSVYGFSLTHIMIAIIFVRILATIGYYFLTIKIFPSAALPTIPATSTIKKLFSYGSWITISSILNPILVNMDRFFIGSILSMKILTSYAAPMEAVQRMRFLPNSLMVTLFPEFSEGISSNNQNLKRQLFGKSIKIILGSCGIISMSLFAFSNEIIFYWLGAEYVEKSGTVLSIISISILFNFIALVPSTFLQGIGRPDLTAKFHVIEALFYVALLYFLIKHFGLIGAALAWSIRVIADFFLLFLWSGKFLNGLKSILFEEKIHLIIVALFVFAGLQIGLKEISNVVLIQVLILFFSIALILAFYWKIILDNAEKKLIKRVYGKILKSFRSNDI